MKKNLPLLVSLAGGVLLGFAATVMFRAGFASGGQSFVSLYNGQKSPVMAYVAFGADSAVLPTAWPFCTPTAKLNCQFPMPGQSLQVLPLEGNYLNATISFGAPVGCGSTKAELNVNNPNWYDTLDVSLVDGYSNNVLIEVVDNGQPGIVLGPPRGKTGNEKVLGVFPYGCDCCVERKNPPCGIPTGRDGCKSGSQYDPDVPCQWQGSVKGGASVAKVVLVGGTPL